MNSAGQRRAWVAAVVAGAVVMAVVLVTCLSRDRGLGGSEAMSVDLASAEVRAASLDSAPSALEVDPSAVRSLVVGDGSERGRVVGRCVSAGTRSALPGVVVAVHAYGEQVGAHGTHVEFRGTVTASSQADGTFAVDVPLVTSLFTCTLESATHVRRRITLRDLGPRKSRDLGTIEFTVGGRVSGRLVGPWDARFGNVYVTAAVSGVDLETGGGAVSCLVDRRGEFVLGPLPGGPHRLGVIARRWQFAAADPVVVSVVVGQTVAGIEVPVVAVASLSGVVLGADGEPVAGASVRVESEPAGDEAVGAPWGETDARGRFELLQTHVGQGPRLRLHVDADGHVPYVAREAMGWNEQTTVRLAAARPLWLRVIDAVTEAPVERFATRLWRSAGAMPGIHGPWREANPDASGGSPVWGIDATTRSVEIRAEHHATEVRAIGAVSVTSPDPWVIRLRRSACLQVQVVDAAGQPVSGCAIEVLGDGAQVTDRVHEHHGSLAGDGSDPTNGRSRVLARARSAPDGTAIAPDLPPIPCWVRCPGDGGPPCWVGPMPLRAGETCSARLQLPPVAALRGRAQPGGSCLGLRLRQVDGPWHLPVDPARSFPIERDGAFRIDHLLPGTWTVLGVVDRALGAPGRGTWSTVQRGEVPLATVVLGSGSHDVELDVSAAKATIVAGRILVDGHGLEGAEVQVRTEAAGAVWWSPAVTTDLGGLFRCPGLPAGVHRIYWQWRSGRDPWVRGVDPNLLESQPGGASYRSIEARLGRVAVTVTADGAPCPALPLRVGVAGWPEADEPVQRTDLHGQLRFAALLPGEWQMRSPGGRPLFCLKSQDLDTAGHAVVQLAR